MLEDQLYVDVVLGAGGEHLEVQHVGHVLRLVPGDKTPSGGERDVRPLLSPPPTVQLGL